MNRHLALTCAVPSSLEPVTGFYERTRSAKKVIVADLGFLGDSAHLVPACWELKRNYSQAQIHTLSATVGAELLQMAPCVDRAWAYPLSKPSPPFWKHLDILRALRREKFDVAFNFSGADRPVYLTALIGARHRLACAAGRHHFYNRWLIPNWVPRPARELPVFEQRRQVLAAAGLSLEAPRFDLCVPDDAQVWAKETVHVGAIHLSPNASSPFKEWPLENWIAFVPQIAAQTGRPLVITGDGSSRERQRIEALMSAEKIVNLRAFPDRLPLAKLSAMLHRCALHVGADSGITHLAAALGVPTVTVYRDYDGRQEWTPPGSRNQQLVVPCPCIPKLQSQCETSGRAECLATVTSTEVVAACLRLLT